MEQFHWVWAGICISGVLVTWVLMRQSHITAMHKERRKHERCYEKLEWYESRSFIVVDDGRGGSEGVQEDG